MSYFNAEMHQIRFRLGLRPRPLWGSLQRSPDPLAGLRGPTSKGREGRGGKGRGRERGERGGKGKGEREGEGRERGRESVQLETATPPRTKSWLRHWPQISTFTTAHNIHLGGGTL